MAACLICAYEYGHTNSVESYQLPRNLGVA